MPLISALRRQRQEDICEFKVSLVYIVSSRLARAAWCESLSQNQINSKSGGWRDGLAGKSTDEGPEFKSQQPHGGSQPWDLTPSSDGSEDSNSVLIYNNKYGPERAGWTGVSRDPKFNFQQPHEGSQPSEQLQCARIHKIKFLKNLKKAKELTIYRSPILNLIDFWFFVIEQ